MIAFGKHYMLPIKYEIVDAVDGKTLDAYKLIDQGVLGDAGMQSLLDSKNGISKRYHYELGSIGAIGCSLSHIKIWRKMIEENTKYMMVFEDDAWVIGISMDDIILRLEDLPEDWHVYMIGQPHSILEGIPVPNKKQLYKLTRFCGTHAYIINNAGARYLIEKGKLFPIQQQIDAHMSELGWDHGLNIYMHLNKPMFGTFGGSSDIQVRSDKSTWERFRLT
jgi:GR25 family glycosyltransferase involved in LPS biosynthesis